MGIQRSYVEIILINKNNFVTWVYNGKRKNYLQQLSFITKVTLSGLTSTFRKCEKGMTRTNVTMLSELTI